MRKLIMCMLAALGVASTLSIAAAAPAAAEIKFCTGEEPVYCDIAYQVYRSGGVNRSSVDGWFKGWTGSPTPEDEDFIEGKIQVRDIADKDGYRARVWVNLYADCWCIDRDYRILGKTFDAFTSAGTTYDYYWHDIAGPDRSRYYALQVIVGRYKNSTGACEPLDQAPFNPGCGEYVSTEQRFYLDID